MIPFLKRKYINLISDSRFSEILKGSIWAFSARIYSTVLGLAFSVVVARFYGAEVIGIVAVINSFLMLATIFSVLGTPTSILRLIPEHLAKYSPTSAFKVYRKTQNMVIGVSLITSVVFFFGANIIADKVFSKSHLSYYFALSSAFIVFQSLMNLNTQAVRGLKLIRVFALMQALPQSFSLVFLITVEFLWPAKDAPIYAMLFGFAMTGIVGWIITEYAFKKRVQTEDRVEPVSCGTILTISLPMLMTNTMIFIIGETGVIILGMFRSASEVGYYSIAVKIAMVITIFLHAVNSMVGPKFSELFHSDKLDELFHVAKKSSKLLFYITLPILIGLLVFGKLILILAFGKEFGIAYPALVLLLFGQFVNSICGANGLFMDMTGNQYVFKNIMFMTAGLNIILNFCLVPSFGIKGASTAAMASIVFWNITTLVYIKIKFKKSTGYFPSFHFEN